MKFYETIKSPTCAAIISGRRLLSSGLRSHRVEGGYQVHTYSSVPYYNCELLEFEIADEHIPLNAGIIIEDMPDGYFLLPKNVIDLAKVRKVTDDELAAMAKEEIHLGMLPPDGKLVRDYIAACPKNKRVKEFGKWTIAAYDEWNARQH